MATRNKASLGIKPFDPAEYLKSNEEIAEFLGEFVEGKDTLDSATIMRAIAVAAQAHGHTKLAEKVGVTRMGLNKALKPNGNPGFILVVKIMNALGVRMTTKPPERRVRARAKSKRPRIETAHA